MSQKGKNSILGIALGVLLAKLLLKLAHGGRRLAWRWRRLLTPLWVGVGLWFFAVLYRWLIPSWWALVLVVPVGGLVLAVVGPRLSERYRTIAMKLVPDGLDRGTDGVLDRVPERSYLAVLCGTAGTYLAVRIGWGASYFTEVLWQTGVLVLGGIWWWHRRIRVAGRADKYARRWGKITRGKTGSMELRALTGSKPVKVQALGSIARLKIKLQAATTQEQVARCVGALASYMPKMRPNSVFYAPDEDSAQHCWYTFIPENPWKGKIDHPMPAAGSTTLRKLGFKFPMGIYATTAELVYRLQHTLLVGQSGSGKSMWIHALMVWLCACRDVVIVAIDMAGGATLGVWRKVLALPLATDLDQARHVLERILAMIEVRERQLGLDSETNDDADDEFMPSPETPWLVLIIDEFPDLVAAGRAEDRQVTKTNSDGKQVTTYIESIESLMGRIAKRARKCGVRVVPAAQNGSKPDVGSKEMQAQLKCVIGLGLDPHANKVLWGEATKQGWSSAGLKNGQFVVRDEDHAKPEIAKGWFVSTKDRRETVRTAMELGRPVLEPTSWAALCGTRTGPDGTDRIVIDMVTEPEERLDAVIALIRDQYPRGVTAADLDALPRPADGSGLPARATIFRWLRKAETRGQVASHDGLWHYIQPADRNRGERDAS